MARLVLMLLATGRRINRNCLVDLLYVLEKDVASIFISINISHNCFSSAIESKLQSVHAYVGHPV